MKQVVIINGLLTSEETTEFVKELSKKLDKVTTPAGDMPGFIANRILTPYINEAIFALYEGVGTAEDIFARSCQRQIDLSYDNFLCSLFAIFRHLLVLLVY